ncbi:DNA repair protein RadC [Sulfurifustis variabilis]|uniref:DNA repair protein RadC n=1 Tax=Sulfurifustis variabilis TaxID=1675686 RepID=A0A1B4V7W4_9GAMM|nr:DNA repair protein RadC [Sulfurifustis variabilis]BAU49613.1 DNA repair protein RadC [Sulfurifustis variabilis]
MSSTLYVRKRGRRYRPAEEREVLAAAAELLGARVIGEALNSPRDCAEFLRARFARREHEVFSCLYLDNRHRVLAFEELFRGTLNGTAVYPREIIKRTLEHNAAAVILVHNHPSGVAEPSRADELLTTRVREALQLVDVRLLDHLVVGDGEVVSFSERGLL